MALGSTFADTMAAARQGDEQAITALYRDVNPALSRYLRAREPQEAEDMGSEVWLVLARQLRTFSGSERQWWALVFLVARRCLGDHWKKERRRTTAPVPLDTFADYPGRSDVEAEVIGAISSDAAVDLVVKTLTPDQADVILLRILGDLDVDDVARVLGKRSGAIRVLQHRAVRKLAEVLPQGSVPR